MLILFERPFLHILISSDGLAWSVPSRAIFLFQRIYEFLIYNLDLKKKTLSYVLYIHIQLNIQAPKKKEERIFTSFFLLDLIFIFRTKKNFRSSTMHFLVIILVFLQSFSAKEKTLLVISPNLIKFLSPQEKVQHSHFFDSLMILS